MENRQRHIATVVSLIAILIFLLGTAGFIYLKRPLENNQTGSTATTTDMPDQELVSSDRLGSGSDSPSPSFQITGNSLSVVEQGRISQTISLDQDAVTSLEAIPGNLDRFIVGLDVNFDGQNDVGVFTSTGYAGVNNYYDFYIYNSNDKRLEKSSTLIGISNPVVDTDKRQVKSNYRSGPQWYTDVFQFNGETYDKTGDSN